MRRSVESDDTAPAAASVRPDEGVVEPADPEAPEPGNAGPSVSRRAATPTATAPTAEA